MSNVYNNQCNNFTKMPYLNKITPRKSPHSAVQLTYGNKCSAYSLRASANGAPTHYFLDFIPLQLRFCCWLEHLAKKKIQYFPRIHLIVTSKQRLRNKEAVYRNFQEAVYGWNFVSTNNTIYGQLQGKIRQSTKAAP